MRRRTQGDREKAAIERSPLRRAVPHVVLQKPGKRYKTGYRIRRHRRPRIAPHLSVRAEALGLQVARGTPELLQTAWLCRWMCWPKGQDWRRKAVGGLTPTEAFKMYHWRMTALLIVEETLAAVERELSEGPPELIDAVHVWVASEGKRGQTHLPQSMQHLTWDTASSPILQDVGRRKVPMSDESFARLAGIYTAGEAVDWMFCIHLGFMQRLVQLLTEVGAQRICAGGPQALASGCLRRRL